MMSHLIEKALQIMTLNEIMGIILDIVVVHFKLLVLLNF